MWPDDLVKYKDDFEDDRVCFVRGIFDQTRYPWERRLVAFHGALTSAELRVPLLIAET